MSTVIARRSGWIPWVFASGMLVVIAVNAVLITAAFRTFPGLVVQRPYDRGIAYNEELRRSRAQTALAWQVTPRYTGDRLTVRITDAGGAPVDGLAVRVTLSRPLEADLAIAADLAWVDDAYGVMLSLPKQGQWDARIEAIGAAGAHRSLFRLTTP
jgi:nitrogen fixation protein FixH